MRGLATDTRDENKHRFCRSVFPLSHLFFSSSSHPSNLKHLFMSVTVNFSRVSTVSKVVDQRRKTKVLSIIVLLLMSDSLFLPLKF